jgi:hypothetical protein
MQLKMLNQQVRTIVVQAAWAVLVATYAAWATAALAQPASEVAAFENYTPCPSTGRRGGACTGFRIVYKVPPCAGGPARWTNMAWLQDAAAREKLRRDAEACGAPGRVPRPATGPVPQP